MRPNGVQLVALIAVIAWGWYLIRQVRPRDQTSPLTLDERLADPCEEDDDDFRTWAGELRQ